MSEHHDILNDIVLDRAPGTSDTVKNLSTGATFTAEIEGNLDPFLMPEKWARDLRPKFRLWVVDNVQAAAQTMGNIVQFTILGTVVKAELVALDNDPASPQAKFLAIQIINKDR